MENHIVTAEHSFDVDICMQIVRPYLLAQKWHLVDPISLATAIYEDLAGQDVPGDVTEAVQTQIWRRYAAILHHACTQPDGPAYEQAWQELGIWLEKQRRHLPWHDEDREDVVQETLVSLQAQLENKAIRAPRAFLMYALQALRHTAVDRERKRTAVSRGGGQNPLSWEVLNETAWQQDAGVQSEPKARPGAPVRRIETAVSDREAHAQLKAFFRQHLHGEQQIMVAELLFLDGLTPKEAAGLLHKQPHEVRMVKFRIVQTLRSLPQAEQQKLLTILGQQDVEGKDEL